MENAILALAAKHKEIAAATLREIHEMHGVLLPCLLPIVVDYVGSWEQIMHRWVTHRPLVDHLTCGVCVYQSLNSKLNAQVAVSHRGVELSPRGRLMFCTNGHFSYFDDSRYEFVDCLITEPIDEDWFWLKSRLMKEFP